MNLPHLNAIPTRFRSATCRVFQTLLLLGLAFPAFDARAEQFVLYDGSLNTSPATQGWQYLFNPIVGNSAVETVAGGATTLDTTAVRTDQAGYFSKNPLLPILAHPNVPTLDRTKGFTVCFELQLHDENHDPRDDNNDLKFDRAGFAMIVVTEDLMALELAFFEDEVWAYEDDSSAAIDLFTHAEGVLMDTTAAISYGLQVSGTTYSLLVGNTPVLTGPLRDYSSFTGLVDPYEVPSFLFLGDDTSSADASASLFSVSIKVVPEPASAALAAIAALALAACAWRRRR